MTVARIENFAESDICYTFMTQNLVTCIGGGFITLRTFYVPVTAIRRYYPKHISFKHVILK